MPTYEEGGIVHEDPHYSLKAAIAQAKKLGIPSFKLVHELELVLAAAFADTQARAHVITGSLKASGKTSSDFDGEDWKGEISYGGASAGPNNPVDYAIYEMARGGDHDFFAGLPGYESKFESAIEKYLVPGGENLT